jgi:hypothetical protein
VPRDWEGIGPVGPHGVTSADMRWGTPAEGHVFRTVGEQHYQLEVPECSAIFDVDRIWRDRNDICAELGVTCNLKGARGFDGNIYSGNVNLSNAYRRRDVCSRLRDRANTGSTVDWDGLMDELAARVVRAEREGRPAQLVSHFERPVADDTFNLDGLILPKHHPSIAYGDGGVCKSLIALFFAGWLGQNGVRTLFCDWELEGTDHRERLQRLFGDTMPPVFYLRMNRPMVDEIDGIRREIEKHGIQYVICDSVAFAINGAPESAEAAMQYFRCVRQFGCGSLHLAHVVKTQADGADPTKPFGSTFWHNSARCTWLLKRSEDTADGRVIVALTNTKANLGARRPAVGFAVDFTPDRTLIRDVDLAEVEEFASQLPLRVRLQHVLKHGPMTIAALAEEIGGKTDSIQKTLKRGSKDFVRAPDLSDGTQRWALLERRTA